MRNYFKTLIIPLVTLGVFSCTSEEPVIDTPSTLSRASIEIDEGSIMRPEYAIKQFATILSKAVYSRQDVREFLKDEALKRFDGNTDVLYGEIKNTDINGSSFRDILIGYSSLDLISNIERSIPDLNIFVPEMPMFDVTVENMDCSDFEIPVCVSTSEGMDLYINGEIDTTIPEGELPDFNTIVVNSNSIVEVEKNDDNSYANYILPCTIANEKTGPQKIISNNRNEIDKKAYEAFKYFYKDDVSANSRYLQRDYIYYGITPNGGTGLMNYGVTEYLGFMEVNPRAYFSISDEWTGNDEDLYQDPRIIENTVSIRNGKYTTEELITNMWSKGVYNFRFEIFSSTSSMSVSTVVMLYPKELWEFNIDYKYTKGNTWKHSKRVYKIDPSKFTPKRVDLRSQNITFGKWDLSKEALERYVSIYEEDKGTEFETSRMCEMSRLNSYKVSGMMKFGLGTEFDPVNGSIDISTSTTTKEAKTFTYRRTDKDDALGTIKIYFYDPLILEETADGFVLNSYNTGVVNFSLMVK